MGRRALLCLFLGVLVGASLPTAARAQRWELDARRVIIDYDYAPYARPSGEQIPAGWGIAARRLLGSDLFLQLELSRGAESRPGDLCAGTTIEPELPPCPHEVVAYSGGLAAFSVGWAGRVLLGERWSLGIRPRVGTGALWVRESGQETRGHNFEHPLTVLAGTSGELAYWIPSLGVSAVLFSGADWLKPLPLSSCADCRDILDEALPQYVYGLGVSWRPR